MRRSGPAPYSAWAPPYPFGSLLPAGPFVLTLTRGKDIASPCGASDPPCPFPSDFASLGYVPDPSLAPPPFLMSEFGHLPLLWLVGYFVPSPVGNPLGQVGEGHSVEQALGAGQGRSEAELSSGGPAFSSVPRLPGCASGTDQLPSLSHSVLTCKMGTIGACASPSYPDSMLMSKCS